MMTTRHVVSASVLATVAATAFACACNSSSHGKVKNTEQVKERLLANLKHQFPSLAELNPTLGDITKGPGCMDQVEMSIQTPRGEQKQAFLITPDSKQLYMLVGEPIDVSKTVEEIGRERAREREQRQTELAKLATQAPERGPANAPVTIVAFSDFQCPYCKRASGTVAQVLHKYPDKVKLAFVSYPLPFHDWARPAAIAGICAAEQSPKAFWTLHDAYFANQQEITKDNLTEKSKEYLQGTGIDMSKWSTCATDQSADAYKQASGKLDGYLEAGRTLGVEGTPAFFVNGEFLNGAVPLQEFDSAIEAALKKGS